jgi:hypothetical protein
MSGAALRRGGDAAASGVARPAARGARAEPGFDRRRALEPDRVQSSRVASLGRRRPGAPRATDQHAPPRRAPGRPASDLLYDRRVQRAADSPAEAEEPRGRRSRLRPAHRGGRVLSSRRAAGRRGHAAGGLAQAADPLGEVELFTVIATLGAPLDVTAANLAIETFLPMDPEARRGLPSSARADLPERWRSTQPEAGSLRCCRRADRAPETHPARLVRAARPARAERLARDARRPLLAAAESRQALAGPAPKRRA